MPKFKEYFPKGSHDIRLDSDSCIALDHIDLTRLHQRKRSLVEGVLPEEDGDITGVIE